MITLIKMDYIYNISPNTEELIKKVNHLRERILLTSLSPLDEKRLQWEINLERIRWFLSFSENPPTKSDIADIILNPHRKKQTEIENDVLTLRDAFDYIYNNWTASNKQVELNDIKKLYNISSKPLFGNMKGVTDYSLKIVENLLKFINHGNEHPIVQAGIVQVLFEHALLFEKGNSRIAKLLSYVFLYRKGFDIRNMLFLEEFYRKDILNYRSLLTTTKKNKNMSAWIEYFVYVTAKQLEKTLAYLSESNKNIQTKKYIWKLNRRQIDTLKNLANPELKITNIDYQKKYSVSQITASRDLSKMANLKLLLSHNKGRSTYYTIV